MIDSLFNSGSLPGLERMVEFTEKRQEVLADDAANLSTPGFLPRDLDTKAFQAALGAAITKRRSQPSGGSGPLELQDTQDLKFTADGMQARPKPSNEGILFHDGNNRDLERLSQHSAENSLAHTVAIELIREQLATIKSAIAERV